MRDPEQWIDPDLCERETQDAYVAMQNAQSEEEAYAVWLAYGDQS
jgi:hypothetical protein